MDGEMQGVCVSDLLVLYLHEDVSNLGFYLVLQEFSEQDILIYGSFNDLLSLMLQAKALFSAECDIVEQN